MPFSRNRFQLSPFFRVRISPPFRVIASPSFSFFSSFHISGAPVSGTLGRIKDSPQDITVRSCSHSFPSPSINRSITSFSGLIVGVGDGDGVTEGVGVEDGIGVTEGAGVSVSAGVPSGVEVTVGVGGSSDAITFSESEAAGKVFSVSVMHESSSPELKISSKLSGVPNSAACTGTVAVISATVRNTLARRFPLLCLFLYIFTSILQKRPNIKYAGRSLCIPNHSKTSSDCPAFDQNRHNLLICK